MELRDLPSVDSLADRVASRHPDLPRPLVVELTKAALDSARSAIQADQPADPEAAVETAASGLSASRPRRVINATGVLLHTNLGRAPLAADASSTAAQQAVGYGNVEFDVVAGARGGRVGYGRKLAAALTGAEDALAVNNNAGALFLALVALASGRRVVVSRGELIEIGGSFRLPELMAASGAELVEVGTTNRTRIADYEMAVNGAALLLKVHPSNYRIDGFTAGVGYRQLAELAADRGIPFVADVGSGLLDTRTPWLGAAPPDWLGDEPGVRQTLEVGASLVLFSGDKLLGGPQAGIAVGEGALIEAMAGHPVARALRLDGPTAAALSGTLELYASGRGAEVPFWKMAALGYEELEQRHAAVLAASGADGRIVVGESVPGAGSVPGETITSPNIELAGDADAWWKGLVANDPPIVGRRRDDSFALDLRTVDPADDAVVASRIRGG
jgi:L-seryl-tRNA(Ser) seleniumtransferase